MLPLASLGVILPLTYEQLLSGFVADFAETFGLRALEVALEQVRLGSQRKSTSLASWTAIANELERIVR